MSLKSFYIYSRDSKNYRCQICFWLLVKWYDIIGCHSNKNFLWKKVYHSYTNRKGITNALKTIYTPYAKNQYSRVISIFVFLKNPGVTYTSMAKFFYLNTLLRNFGLWNFFLSFLAVCMADLWCSYADLLLKYPNCWFKNIIFNPRLFQQFHVFYFFLLCFFYTPIFWLFLGPCEDVFIFI